MPSAAAALPRELEAPAPRSSLALSLELQSARAAVAGGQFDASKAVEEQLRKSFQTRCVLEEAVAEGEGAGGRPGAGVGDRAQLTPASRAPARPQA